MSCGAVDGGETVTLKSLRRVFADFDEGGKGWLTRQDLRMAMTALLGYRPSKTELHTLVPDSTGASKIDEATFVQIMSFKLSTRDTVDDIRKKFMTLDSHFRGYLMLEDILPALKSVGVPETTIHQIFVQTDTDRDGKITFKDFERMMKYP
ncbi:hypothetical protein Pelo_4733 [Pelomyxa schiedti]|nr:hypothetical protein Pelo_4733 [Pelomyxa schiedti]